MTMMVNNDMRDAVDRILAMRKVEASYSFESLLNQQSQLEKQRPTPLVSDTWRSKVCQWAFNVVDHFALSREVVTVSMGMFDRYIATRGIACTGNMVLLTSLTTLHLAIKLHETKRIKSSVLANLSRGQFDTSHIDEMEMDILATLKWKLHPPTPLAFIFEFLNFLPEDVTPAERKEVYELSKYLSELAVCESSFVDRQSSVIALAAVQNVIQSMKFVLLSAEAKESILVAISDIMGHTYESETMRETRERLNTMFAKVSATECFEAAYGAYQHHPGNHSYNHPHSTNSPLGGTRLVSPSGSPSSTASSGCYDTIHGRKSAAGAAAAVTTTSRKPRTNFWYTPSPPPARPLGVVGSVRVSQGC